MATMVLVEMMMFVSRCPGVVKVSIAWLLSDTFCLGPARPYSACWVWVDLIEGAPIPSPSLSAYQLYLPPQSRSQDNNRDDNILDIDDHDDGDDGDDGDDHDDHDNGDDADDGDDCLNQFYNLASMSERPNFQTTRFSSSHTLLLPCSVKFHLDDRDHHNDHCHRW